MSELRIRQGMEGDYSGLLTAEDKAWQGTGVPLISRQQFESWLEVFPEGLLIAEKDDQICGHVFSQICSFDPADERDHRNWMQMTNNGFVRTTHNPAGNVMYNVSTSACEAGAGRKLLRAAFEDSRQRQLRYYVGASSISGVLSYANSQDRKLDRALVEEYVAAVLRRHKLRFDLGPKITDPVVSITLSCKHTTFFRLLENYFDYPAAGNWAMLLAYVNPDWS